MKVLEPSNEKMITRIQRCPTCDALLEYTRADIHYLSECSDDCNPRWIICPCCGHNIYIHYW